jgi:hypothetical protein
LAHPLNRLKVNQFLCGKKLRTLYKNRSGEHKEFKYEGISQNSSKVEKAYEGFLNVTVQQHMYIY